MPVTTLPFGTAPDGRPAHLYLLSNGHGMVVGATDLGACLVSCRVPDGEGRLPDVLLGYDSAAGYADNLMAFGGTVGRVANRIGGASFELGGTTYGLSANLAGSCLHGGRDMWFQRRWKAGVGAPSAGASSVTFSLLSPDGDQGFPGDLDVRVTYALDDEDRLSLHYLALPSAPTLVNLCCHAYWNLNGHASGDVRGHSLQVEAGRYTVTDKDLVPTGELAPVEGTPLDLRRPRRIGDCLAGVPGGLDHNFALDARCGAGGAAGAPAPTDGGPGRPELAATLVGERSRIRLRVLTTAPGLQVFTAGGLCERHGKDGAAYGPSAGVALETQLFPGAIHHPGFPAATDPVFGPGRPFESETQFCFDLA
jgi:aldose 1-epimerase